MKNDFGYYISVEIDAGQNSQCLAFQVTILHVSLSKPVDWIMSNRAQGNKMIEQFFLCVDFVVT